VIAELTRRLSVFAVVTASLTAATGCAGARTSVVADEAQYPVSLSRAVRDEQGKLVTHEQVTKVGSFKHTDTAWGILYSAVKLNPRTDISEALNEQVALAGGDAVVNLRVKSTQCATDAFVIFTAIPFWPGCVKLAIEGDIIKVQTTTSAAGTNGAPSKPASAGARLAVAEAVR
jgi:hypothetical protein